MATSKQAERDGFFKRRESRFWWVRTDPITGKAKSSGCTDLEAARIWRTRRERLNADPARAASEAATLGEWAARLVQAKKRDSSEATVVFYGWKLGHFIRLWGADCKLAAITPVLVDRYVAQRRAEHVVEHTISKEIGCLVQVLKLAKRAQVYSGDLTTIRPPDLHASYTPRKRALSRVEVDRLRANTTAAGAAFVALCVGLGCRRSEALKLAPGDIDLERGVAHIQGTKTEGSNREVPILSVFRELVASALPALPLGSVRRAYVSLELRRACMRAGIPHASPNDLRRTHATWLLEAGVDRDVIRRLLGHSTTRLVDSTYGQPTPAALAALAEAKLPTTSQVSSAPSEIRLVSRRVVRPCPPDSSLTGPLECTGNPGDIRIVTRQRPWRRLGNFDRSNPVPSQGYWAGKRSRVAA